MNIRKIFSSIFGTNEHYRARISENLENRMKHFKSLNVFNAEVKKSLSPSIKDHEEKMAKVDVWRIRFIIRAFRIIKLVLFFIAIGFTGYISIKGGMLHTSSFKSIEHPFFMIILVIATYAVFFQSPYKKMFLRNIKEESFFIFPWLIIIRMVLPLIILAFIFYIASIFAAWFPYIWVFIFFNVFIFYLSLTTSFFVSFFLGSLLDFFLQRRMDRFYPDSAIIDAHLELLVRLEEKKMDWLEIDSRKQLLALLDRIANLIRCTLPRKLWCGSAHLKNWYEEESKQVAAAYDELKKLIYNPNQDNRKQFIRKVADNLIHIAGGNWDQLERLPHQDAPAKTLRQRVFVILKTFLNAGFPLLIFWGVQQTSLAIDKPPVDYITIALIIWAILTVALRLDPLTSVKIALMKNLSPILPTPQKEKK